MTKDAPAREVSKTEDEWRAQLDATAYDVMRKQGTERAFTGEYWDTHDAGVYRCRACEAELFRSEAKFDSGCGWPSFTEPSVDANIESNVDTSHFMVRTELKCRRCGGHLGHVFPDGPGPTGQRYCINSASLSLDRIDP